MRSPLEAEVDGLRAALRTTMDRLALIERRLADHDQQIATLDDSKLQHEATLAAFNGVMEEVAALRKALGVLSDDVAEARQP